MLTTSIEEHIKETAVCCCQNISLSTLGRCISIFNAVQLSHQCHVHCLYWMHLC